MSILLLNKTVCPICHEAITDKDDYYSFPAFVINIKDPLYFFSDITCHLRCLNGNKMALVARKYAELFIERVNPTCRKCIVTGDIISDPQNHIFIEYLTSDESNYLHQFNFIHIDKRNLNQWDKAKDFKNALIALKKSGLWEEVANSNYLSRLIEVIST